MRVMSFLMKSVLLSRRVLSSVFSVSLWKGLSESSGSVAVVAVMLAASSRLELRWKMVGASALFVPFLSTRLELWESPLGFFRMVDLLLLSSRPRVRTSFGGM